MKQRTIRGRVKDVPIVESLGTQHNTFRNGVSHVTMTHRPNIAAKVSQLLEMNASGHINMDIAAATGLRQAEVSRLLKRYGRQACKLNKPPTPEQEARVLELIKTPLTKAEIAKQSGLSYSATIKVLAKHRVSSKRRDWGVLPTETETKIVEAYDTGISQNEVCRQFDINAKRFNRIMAKYGKPVKGRFKHDIRSDYFDSIDTFYKAYLLGWLASDGCIAATRDNAKNRNNVSRMGKISISIQERDCYIVSKLKEELATTAEIKNIDKGPGRQRQCRLGFCDQHMAQTLYRRGLTDDKSFSFKFPEVPDEWLPAFILGYFDGDGSVTWGDYIDVGRGYKSIRQAFSIIGSVPFCDALLEILTVKYGIAAYGVDEKRKSQPLKNVKGSSKEAMLAFYHLVYAKAPFCLQRKKAKFEELFVKRGISYAL